MLDKFQDLSFRAVRNYAPLRLTETQIDSYNRQGFVQPFSIFSESEIGGIRAYTDRLMTDMGVAGGYGINCSRQRWPGFGTLRPTLAFWTMFRILSGPTSFAAPQRSCRRHHMIRRPFRDIRMLGSGAVTRANRYGMACNRRRWREQFSNALHSRNPRRGPSETPANFRSQRVSHRNGWCR